MSKKNTNIKIKRFLWPFPKGKGLRGTNDKFLRIIIDYDKMEVYRQKPKGKDNWHESDKEKFNSLTQEELINYFPNPKKDKPKLKKDKPKPKKDKPKIKEDISAPTPTPSSPESKLESKLERKQKNEIVNKTIFNDCEALLELIKSSEEKIKMSMKEYKKVLKCIENKNKEQLSDDNDFDVLYPQLDDINFTLKLTKKKEFYDVKIEEKTREEIENIEEVSNNICSPSLDFELEPHQMFVRNFLSFQTPYNSLLLFHGLGTGKTCSSISVCEDMRIYYKQIGNKKKIMIVASPNVQENYKLQLFDERKLRKINGLWNIKSCTGNKFIKEVNPMNMLGLSREKIVKQINKIIKQSYEFIGYTEFSNQIERLTKNIKTGDKDKDKLRKIKLIKREFSNRLLIIDEVHNIRSTSKEESRRTTQNMLDLVKYSDNLKLLLLTATPMFNDVREIVWLLNLMNINDKRFPIKIKDIFDKKGEFKKDTLGNEVGKELLTRKMIGYVSYVSGEDPFKFPSRIWPNMMSNPHSIKKILESGEFVYPKRQINGLEITTPIRYLDLVITKLSSEQNKAYNYIIRREKEKNPILNEEKKGIQYTVIDGPLQALNIIYPHDNLQKETISDNIEKYLYGQNGLSRIMLYDKNKKKGFKYVKKIKDKYGRIFSSIGSNPPLKKYSAKIYQIIKKIKKSKGIVLIYSNYIDGGCVPIALALEEMGITRLGGKENSFFAKAPVVPFKIGQHSAKYVMITGDKLISPSNKKELKACTDSQNINGEKVKVIVISKAGSEGLDFKNIRQIHIMEPWYNLNRADQIIGRGVRNKSHCDLPFNERTVEIYLYGTELIEKREEAIDLYVYRLAEYKALQIGKVSRLLKQHAVDCILNKNQLGLIENRLNKKVKYLLSDGKKINFHLGHKNNSLICDFMNCEYNCLPNNEIKESDIIKDSYTESYIVMNLEKILQRIKALFREHYVYKKSELIKRINAIKNYSTEQINMALNVLITDKNEYLIDILGRTGKLINIDEYYMFQPIELDNKHITTLERRRPMDVKSEKISIRMPFKLKIKDTIQDINKKENLIYQLQNDYMIATRKNPKNKSWKEACGWVIDNLVKYNGINRDTLKILCLEHLFDILNINDKLIILNSLYLEDLNEDFKSKLLEMLEKFTLRYKNVESESKSKSKSKSKSGHEYVNFIVSDYDKTINKKINYNLFKLDMTKNPPEWSVGGDKSVFLHMKSLYEEKFLVSDNEEYNDEIGFLTKSGQNVVFKTKRTIIDKSERVNKGKRCPSAGEKRNITIKRLNNLISNINDGKKYEINKKGKQQKIIKIYGNAFEQIYDGKNPKKMNMSDIQLCVEIEMILRLLDLERKNGKRWFFSTVGDVLNKISLVKKNDE